jgi:hypothetical protein
MDANGAALAQIGLLVRRPDSRAFAVELNSHPAATNAIMTRGSAAGLGHLSLTWFDESAALPVAWEAAMLAPQ